MNKKIIIEKFGNIVIQNIQNHLTNRIEVGTDKETLSEIVNQLNKEELEDLSAKILNEDVDTRIRASILDLYATIGKKFVDQGNSVAGFTYYLPYLKESIKRKENALPFIMDAYSCILDVLLNQFDLQEARNYLIEFEKYTSTNPGTNNEHRSYYFYFEAFYYQVEGSDPQTALDFITKGLEIQRILQTEDLCWFQNLAGTICQELNDNNLAKFFFENGLNSAIKHFGSNDPKLVHHYTYLSSMFLDEDCIETKRLMEKAVRINEDSFGEDHLKTAYSYTYLGTALFELEEYKNAENVFKKSLPIYEKNLGIEHPDTIGNYSQLGNLYFAMENYESAKELIEKAYTILVRTLGEESPETINEKENLDYINDLLK